MFETEGDTLANVFASDYGNYSDGFRKAFHHEPISYTRRKDREFVELLRPRLSAVLSGTPRQISALVRQLKYSGYDAYLLVPEDYDVSLRARVERANTWCRQIGKRNVCLVSIHTNAAGNGKQWMNARGWTCYTSRGQTAGDHLADCLYQAAALWLPGHKLRKDYSDGDPDWESDFYILKNTLCAAALSENLFHDNADDLAFLESVPGRQAIIDLHVRAIIRYLSL